MSKVVYIKIATYDYEGIEIKGVFSSRAKAGKKLGTFDSVIAWQIDGKQIIPKPKKGSYKKQVLKMRDFISSMPTVESMLVEFAKPENAEFKKTIKKASTKK